MSKDSSVAFCNSAFGFDDFNDENNEPVPEPTPVNDGNESTNPQEPPKPSPVKVNRVTKKLGDYTSGRVINIDSEEKLADLDDAFEKIKESIRKDLKAGKKITLQYVFGRSAYFVLDKSLSPSRINKTFLK